ANRLEHAIAEIWQQVLKLKQVGVNDNFFDLGGHSLLMAQVHRRLREELRVDVPMIELLKYPTVSSLSRRLDGNETNSPDNGTAVLEKLTAGQLRLKQLRSVNRVSTVTR
ncbi:MAG TPA: phosphopantetheine-binding protein, partial [Pyrinomonadaceae bacterium]|nr:phosphopantetheine-binding protein [Pyrinomonadaceae bacterium]